MSKRKNISNSIKSTVAGRQYFKCANDHNADLDGIGTYKCPLWNGENKGSFDESGYEIDHKIEHCLTKNDDINNLQALCKSCHQVKSKMFQRSDTAKQLMINKRNTKKLMSFTIPTLKDVLRSNGKKTTGKKSELIERIVKLGIDINLSVTTKPKTTKTTKPKTTKPKTTKTTKPKTTKPKTTKNVQDLKEIKEKIKREILIQDLKVIKEKIKREILIQDLKVIKVVTTNEFLLKQLKQICIFLKISPNGTKGKLVNKINKQKCSVETLKKMEKGRYMIKCINLKSDDYHVYFTNTKLSKNNEPLINNHRKINGDNCPECKETNRYMLEYTNEFCK